MPNHAAIHLTPHYSELSEPFVHTDDHSPPVLAERCSGILNAAVPDLSQAMRVLHRSTTHLTVQHRPFTSLAYSLLFLAVAVIVPLYMAPQDNWEIALLWGLGFMAIALVGFYFTEWVTCTANLPEQTLTVHRRSLFRDRHRRYALEQVSEIEIRTRLYKGGLYYRLYLRLDSPGPDSPRLGAGNSIPLMSSQSISGDNTRAIAQELSRFLHRSVRERHCESGSYFTDLLHDIR